MATTTAGTEYASELTLAELPWFRQGIDEDNPFVRRMQATSLGVNSENDAYYVQTGATGKIAYPARYITSEGSTAIPAWAVATHYNPKWSLKEYGMQVRISSRGKSEKKLIGMTSITDQTMKNAQAALAFMKTRHLMGCPAGYLCRVTEVVDANTVTVDDLTAIREGLIVDSYDAITSGNKGIDSKTISYIDPETGKVTITGHGGAAGETDWLFIEDTYAVAGDGLLSLVAHTSARQTDSGVTVTPDIAAYAGLTKSSTSKWTSFAKKLPWGKFEPKYLPDFLAKFAGALNTGQVSTTACYASPNALAALYEALEYDKKTMGESIIYGVDQKPRIRSIWFKNGAVDVEPIPGIGDHKLIFVDETKMGVRQPPSGNGWVAPGGQVWVDNARETTGYPTWTAAWLEVVGLCGNPFYHGVLWNFDNVTAA